MIMDYESIAALAPVNKTSALVTQQSCTEDSFYISQKEELRVLGLRKLDLMQEIVDLKERIGIDAGRSGQGAGTKFPKKILQHPLFKKYMHLKKEATILDKSIFELKKKVSAKKIPDDKFKEYVIHFLKTDYPDLYIEIKNKIRERDNNV